MHGRIWFSKKVENDKRRVLGPCVAYMVNKKKHWNYFAVVFDWMVSFWVVFQSLGPCWFWMVVTHGLWFCQEMLHCQWLQITLESDDFCLHNRRIRDKGSTDLGGSNPGGRKWSGSTRAAVAASHLKRRSQRGEHPAQCHPNCTIRRGRSFCCSCICFNSTISFSVWNCLWNTKVSGFVSPDPIFFVGPYSIFFVDPDPNFLCWPWPYFLYWPLLYFLCWPWP